MFYVYVLRSLKDHQNYIGFTTDLQRRFKEHNDGKSKSTAPRIPFKIIYYEAHTSKVDAMRREKYFKTSKGKSSLKLMLRTALEK